MTTDSATPPARYTAAPRPGWALRARLAAFMALEALSDLRGNTTAAPLGEPPPVPARPAWWVYVSTIGELNAIAPLLDALLQRLHPLPLVLVTDHPHYRASYLARYPQAEVFVTLGHRRDARQLAQRRPPRLMVVAEIPLLPSDAPCRCSAALLLAARRSGAPLVAVNGWLYGYAPSCRMDAIERRWFAGPLLRQFDALCVQTAAVAQQLQAAGAAPQRLHVTGNLKFDALRQPVAWQPRQARSPALVGALAGARRPLVVAGSMTRSDEQATVVEAYAALRRQHSQALLVLALRHPEVPANLTEVDSQLAAHDLPAVRRTVHGDRPLPDTVACLVLDTIGELRDFYALAAVAHVGVDHNVLEPLTHGKPTSTLPGWEATYPSFPVYTALAEAGALLLAQGAAELQAHWQQALQDHAAGRTAASVLRARQALAGQDTSVQRHLEALARCLDRAA